MSERTAPYTITELANEAGVSETYVRRLVADGKIAGRKIGPIWVVDADVGRAWLNERRRKTTE